MREQPRSHFELRAAPTVAWAARMSQDKDPFLFVDAMAGVDARVVMHGDGPLRTDVMARARAGVALPGWSAPSSLWEDADVYVGTSHREAFGRSAVEAAMNGLPVVVSAQFGVAPLLYRDGELFRRFVMPTRDPAVWRLAVEALLGDPALWKRVSDHVAANARALTIAASVDAIAIRTDLPGHTH
ncbi:glycosyltransferase [Geodermatophilus sp. SYSU D00965]